jgi:AcrR family transcriptional regulator
VTRAYGGLSPGERRDDRRERLLEAALAVFGTRGFAASTIDAIAVEAGVALRHFYEAFPDRQALLRAAYDRVIEETFEAVTGALLRAGADPRDRARASLEAFLHAYLDDPRRGRVACIEIVGVSAELERHRRSVIHRFAAFVAADLDALAAAGRLAKRDFRFAGVAIVGAVNELVIDWLMLEERPPTIALRDELLSLLVALFEGAPAAEAYVRRVPASGQGKGQRP